MPVVDDVDITLSEGPDDVFNVTLVEAPLYGRVYLASEVPYANVELPGVDNVEAAIDALLGGIGLSDNYVTLATAQNITGAKTFVADPVFNDAAIPEAKVAGLPADLAALIAADNAEAVARAAADLLAVHLAGAENITGVKTFQANPVFNAGGIAQAAIANLGADLAARALDNTVVHLAGAETITGAKTLTASAALKPAAVLTDTSPELDFQSTDAGGVGTTRGRIFTSWQAGVLAYYMRFQGATRYEFDSGLGVTNLNSSSSFGPVDMGAAFVRPANAAQVGLVVSGQTAQTADLQQWQNPLSTVVAAVKPTGLVTGAGLSLVNSIGVGSVVQTVKAMASQTGDLTQWQDSAGTVLSSVTASGLILTRAASYVGDNNLNSFMLRQASSPNNRFRAALAAHLPVLVQGAASQTADLTQWQDSAGTALVNITAAGNILLGGSVVLTGDAGGVKALFKSTAVGNIPLRAQGFAGQTADLQQWQNSGGSVLASVALDGSHRVPYVTGPANTGAFLQLVTGGGLLVTNRDAASNVVTAIKAMAGQTGDLQQWQNSAGTVQAGIAFDGRAFFGTSVPYSAGTTLSVSSSATTSVPARVRGFAGQTGDLQRWEDSGGVKLAMVDNLGAVWSSVSFNLGAGSTTSYAMHATSNPGTRLIATAAGVTPLLLKGFAAQTAAALEVQDSAAAALFAITAAGRPKWSAAALAQTTVGAAGGAAALPATPTKYLQVVDSAGTTLVVPAYAAA